MRWIVPSIILGLGLLAASHVLHAAASEDEEPSEPAAARTDNPYQLIVDSNPFRLKDPDEEAANAPTNPPPATNVKFTGIYKVDGITKACLALVDPTIKPPANPNKFYSMAVGEWQDGVKVLEIDMAKETVKVESSTGIALLNFKENGFQAAGAPPPPPAGTPQPGGVKPQPGVVAGAPPMPPGANAQNFNPALMSANQFSGQAAQGNVPSVDATAGLRTIPSRQLRTPTGGSEAGAATAIIQYATMKEQEARLRAAGRVSPPVPPLPGFMNPNPAPAPGGNP